MRVEKNLKRGGERVQLKHNHHKHVYIAEKCYLMNTRTMYRDYKIKLTLLRPSMPLKKLNGRYVSIFIFQMYCMILLLYH